ncbi:MAG: S8 family serine peptidase, partial [Actinomycetes bacterium]
MSARAAARSLTAASLAALLASVLVAYATPPAGAQEAGEACDAENPEHIDPDLPNHALDSLGARGVWQRATGKGVTVAVVDSGLDVANEHFPEGSVLPGTSFVPGFPNAQESAVKHGTAVAGLIAARRVPGSAVTGLAPDATLLPVRVFVSDSPNDANPGLDPTAQRIAAGIEYAAANGADVINVSMSSLDPLPALDEAVRQATASGSLVVASAGNNPAEEESPFTHKVWPAASPGALGVTATDTSGEVTDWSTHGPQVDVAAPGQYVYAPNWYAGDCRFVGGEHDEPITSFATPHVAATAALLMQAHPHESPRRIAYRIMASADRPVQGARDRRQGWGFIRPYEALTMTIDPARAGPPVPGARHGSGARTASSVDLHAAGDPLASSKQQVTWWLMLGAAAVVLLLMLGRWVAAAAPRQARRRRRSQEPGRQRRVEQAPAHDVRAASDEPGDVYASDPRLDEPRAREAEASTGVLSAVPAGVAARGAAEGGPADGGMAAGAADSAGRPGGALSAKAGPGQRQ